MIYKSGSSAGSIESTDLMNFSNTLNSQIQDIRKEISSNSKESRSEIEAKLNIINKPHGRDFDRPFGGAAAHNLMMN